jgi:MbtH protein
MNQAMFNVVKNHENQYSIWSDDQSVPDGWELQGIHGTREQCLEHVRTHWVEMTPASLKCFTAL